MNELIKTYLLPLFVMIALLMACEHDSLVEETIEDSSDTTSTDTSSDSTGTSTDTTDTSSDTTVSTTLSFSEDILPILSTNCALSGCHNTASKADGYDFSNYSGTMKAVSAGNATNSKLYKVINSSSSRDRMPPSPYDKLSDTNIGLIKEWINDGALNN